MQNKWLIETIAELAFVQEPIRFYGYTAKFILLQKNLNLIMHLKQGKLRNGTKIIKRLRICKEIWMNKE